MNIPLRDPNIVMKLSRLGSFHQSKLSFLRSFLKEFKDWDYKRDLFELNENGYAEFTDWRLPTLEEAVSLLEPSAKNGNQFIDPAFDKTQSSVWTCDSNISNSSLSLDRAWSVNFNYSLVSRMDIMIERKKVRPVRVYSGD